MSPMDFFQQLIIVGKTNPPEVSLGSEFARIFKSKSGELRKIPKQSNIVIADDDLVYLFKGVILMESKLKWPGGSVALSISVYWEIEKRKLDEDYYIADFALKNSDNPHVPFGTSYFGERTREGYLTYLRMKQYNIDRNNEIVNRVAGRKKKRSQAIANLKKISPENRGKIKRELLAKYSSSTAIDKLQIIANDEEYPPEYYPVEWILITDEEISKLTDDLIQKLYDKLSTKTKSHWKRFAKQLKKFNPDGIMWISKL